MKNNFTVFQQGKQLHMHSTLLTQLYSILKLNKVTQIIMQIRRSILQYLMTLKTLVIIEIIFVRRQMGIDKEE